MSKIKEWREDMRIARKAAMIAAGMASPRERLTAMRVLFGHLGEVANKYNDPEAVARLLVREAVRTFRVVRKAGVVADIPSHQHDEFWEILEKQADRVARLLGYEKHWKS